MDAKITRKNVSLNSEIKSLNSAFPIEHLVEGKIITYEELENIIGQPHRSQRFITIFGKWRHQLLITAGKDLICRINVGYEVANNQERLTHSYELQKQGIRRFKKSAIVQETIDTSLLSKEEREKFNQIRMRNNAIEGLSFKRDIQIPSI